MGGERKHVETSYFQKHRKNVKAWEKIEKGGLVPFLEKLHGIDEKMLDYFTKNWKNGEIVLFGRSVKLNEQIIDEITGLLTEGVKFYLDRRFSDEVVIRFPKKDKEKAKLVKVSNSYFDVESIKSIWRKVLRVIMEYITVDGCFTRAYVITFPF